MAQTRDRHTLADTIEIALSRAFENQAPGVEIDDDAWDALCREITAAVRAGQRKIKVDVPGRLKDD